MRGTLSAKSQLVANCGFQMGKQTSLIPSKAAIATLAFGLQMGKQTSLIPSKAASATLAFGLQMGKQTSLIPSEAAMRIGALVLFV
jgi:hypothetical protein